MTTTKSLPISKEMVYEAWKQIRRNGGSAGIDAESLKDFEEDLSNNLYKLWNRLTSGSYFPQAVKQVGMTRPEKSLQFS